MYKSYILKYTIYRQFTKGEIMNKNTIDCDVASCLYNCLGKECTLKGVKITTDCTDLTCCGSYKNKHAE